MNHDPLSCKKKTINTTHIKNLHYKRNNNKTQDKTKSKPSPLIRGGKYSESWFISPLSPLSLPLPPLPRPSFKRLRIVSQQNEERGTLTPPTLSSPLFFESFSLFFSFLPPTSPRPLLFLHHRFKVLVGLHARLSFPPKIRIVHLPIITRFTMFP